MKKQTIIKCLVISLINLLSPISVMAQVTPDNTLGAENSQVTSLSELKKIVEGGATRGTNLFHSFQEFNVEEGGKVYFNNPEGIANIFSRITGSNISKILGTLGVEGSANLFLINPNGIVFGKNTLIDVGGSFIATTAESVVFEDGNTLVIRDRSNEPILTWAAPIGLTLENTSGEIIVAGSGHTLKLDIINFPNPIDAPVLGTQKTGTFKNYQKVLALIGNKITFNGGSISNYSGDIEIGSIKSGIVGINTFQEYVSFDYKKVSEFENIILEDYSLIDASGIPGGKIELNGKDLFISENSLILNSNQGNLAAGNINILMSGQVNFTGITSPKSLIDFSFVRSGVVSQSFGPGKGSDILISADDIELNNFAQINSITYSSGDGGNVLIDVNNFITIVGKSPLKGFPLVSAISSLTSSEGKSGNINLTGKNLFLKEGGFIISQTSSKGNGGNMDIHFSESINITGGFPLDSVSGNFVNSTLGSTSLAFGEGGDLLINTAKLKIEEGGRINSTTSGFGKAGSIEIRASDLIQISGKSSNSIGNNFFNSSQIIGSSEIAPSFLREIFNLPFLPQGDSGSVSLNTENLILDNGGLITVRNDGTGDAGIINIDSNSILLKTGGNLSASTTSGEGGNIFIKSDRLELFDSNITASAGGEGNGGNIDIKTKTLLGLNSDITATAVQGDGGNININAEGLVGLLESQDSVPNNQKSEIDASSDFGLSGLVVIENPQNTLENPQSTLKITDNDVTEIAISTECLYGSEGLILNSLHRNNPISSNDYLSNILEELTWQPGEEPLRADTIIKTPEGKVFAVNSQQLARIADNSCLVIE